MNPKIFFTVFVTVFLAELGDKTQLATMLFATDKANNKLTIFLAASLGPDRGNCDRGSSWSPARPIYQ